jgi:hypothetical protein
MSDYEVVVLPGTSGQVLIRGGRYFSQFGRARLDGSTLGGSAIRAKTWDAGSNYTWMGRPSSHQRSRPYRA